jgi:hypothetical protein
LPSPKALYKAFPVLTGLIICFNTDETKLKYIDTNHWLDRNACKHLLTEITADYFENAVKKAKEFLT